MQGLQCTYFSTAGGTANATLKSTACTLVSAVVGGSAGGTTLLLYDGSGGSLVSTIIAGVTAGAGFYPCLPIALRAGLACTCSGTGVYSVYYQ
jgi:hypothetical protein